MNAELLCRIPAGSLLTTHDFDLRTAEFWPSHTHADLELLWREAGMAKLYAEGRVWAIPPSSGYGSGRCGPCSLGHRWGEGERAAYFVK